MVQESLRINYTYIYVSIQYQTLVTENNIVIFSNINVAININILSVSLICHMSIMYVWLELEE